MQILETNTKIVSSLDGRYRSVFVIVFVLIRKCSKVKVVSVTAFRTSVQALLSPTIWPRGSQYWKLLWSAWVSLTLSLWKMCVWSLLFTNLSPFLSSKYLLPDLLFTVPGHSQLWFDSQLGLINRVAVILATFPEHFLHSRSGPCVHELFSLILPEIHFVFEETKWKIIHSGPCS